VIIIVGLLGSPRLGTAGAPSIVQVPWRPGNAERFRAGTVEEHGVTTRQGQLPVTLYPPAAKDRRRSSSCCMAVAG
jgi:hypothetical protein